MKIEQATKGGELAADILARQAKIEKIIAILNDGWRVNNIRAASPDGQEISVIVEMMEADISKQTLSLVLQIYQAQLDVLNAELDAL